MKNSIQQDVMTVSDVMIWNLENNYDDNGDDNNNTKATKIVIYTFLISYKEETQNSYRVVPYGIIIMFQF